MSETSAQPGPAERLRRLWCQGQRPDVDAFLADAGPLPAEDLAAVLREDQRQRWQQGERVGAEDYLRRHPGLRGEPSVAVDLAYAEYLLRERPEAAEYLRRFPEHAATLAEQIELHRALAAPSQSATLPAAVVPPAAPAVPGVPGYEILAELGRGGMGDVYKARHHGLNRIVALKMILAGGHADEADRRRFRAEAEAVARLNHPHIVQVHEVGECGGLPYFSLEYCPGGSLEKRLAGTPLPAAEAAALVESLARAMQAAHQCGIVHRDLKPANVLLARRFPTEDPVGAGSPRPGALAGRGDAPPPPAPPPPAGSPRPGALAGRGDPAPTALLAKLTDFGLAKRLDEQGQTQTGSVMGTPSYMAPEQAEGKKNIGPAADVYGLGAILYECLTGRPPFRAATPLDTVLQVITEEPVPPGRLQPKLPRDLETICLKCLEKEPARRYASAHALADDLQRFLTGQPIQARPTGAGERLVKWAKRRPAVAGLVLVSGVAVLAAIGLVTGTFYNARLRVEKERAEAAQQQAEMYRYFHHTARAHAGWREGDLVLMEDLLNACPPEQRRWEWHYLDRLCHADLLTLEHDQLYSMALSPDGTRIATASFDRTVKVWDVTTGQPLRTLRGHTGRVRKVAFSPDGKRLASAGADGTVRLRDATSGAELHRWEGTTVWINRVAFSPDGALLAAAGAEDTVKLWDVATGREALTLKGHTYTVWTVAFSPRGTRLASGSTDNTVKLWDLATGRTVFTLHGHVSDVYSVAFSPDESRLASAGRDGTIKLWDVATGQEALTLRGHTRPVLGVAFSPDGNRIVSASWDGTIQIWDARPLTAEVRAEREAVGLLDFLFAKPLGRADVIEHLRRFPAIGPPARQQALALVQRYREETDPERFYRASWAVARQPYLNAVQYRFALRQAEAACRLAPGRGAYRTALGAAQYRLGRYQDALATLPQAGPADLAFRAMAQHQLGQTERARSTLAQLRELPKARPAEHEQDLLREAEALVQRGKP